DCALYPNSSSHQLDELFANGKTELCTTILTGGGSISLGERRKNVLLLLGRDTNARVAYGKMQQISLRVQSAEFGVFSAFLSFVFCCLLSLDFDNHLTLFRELESVTDEVKKNLA